MYEMTTQIPFTSCGPDNRIKLHEAVNLMMDSCQFQEYQEKEFCKFLRTEGIAIFLFSIQIDILRMPEFREYIQTAVKIYDCKSIYGLRRITMKDEAGKICLISNATGAFFSIREKKALKLTPEQLKLKFDEAEPMECLPRKIPIPAEEGIKITSHTVHSSNLDPNGHLTSSAYFAIAADALPPEYFYNRIRIEYKRQAKPGELVQVILHKCENNKIIVDMQGTDGLTFAAAEFSTVVL